MWSALILTRSKQIAAAVSVLLEGHPHGNAAHARTLAKSMVEHWLGAMETKAQIEIERLRVRSAETSRQLQRAISHLQSAQRVIAKLPLRVRGSFDLKKQIRRGKLWTSIARGPAHRVPSREREAVFYAACLIEMSEQRAGATRGGRWHKLAAILYGDPAAISGRPPGKDFLNLMRKCPGRIWIAP